MATPSTELVDAYLTEIAKAYNVNWAPDPPPLSPGQGNGSDGGSKVSIFQLENFRHTN